MTKAADYNRTINNATILPAAISRISRALHVAACLYLGGATAHGQSPSTPASVEPREPLALSEWRSLAEIDIDEHDSGFGSRLAPAGDLNGDGYADILVGAPYSLNGLASAGAVFILYGGPNGIAREAVLRGVQDNEEFGAAIAGAGDVNGDGYADVMVGSPFFCAKGWAEGKVSVYYGSPQGLASVPDLVLAPGEAEAEFGRALACAGDVNGDGFADLLVGAPGHKNDRGKASLYLGGAGGLQPTPAWSTVGEKPNSMLGGSVDLARNLNGDGFADIVVGEPGYSIPAAPALSPDRRQEEGHPSRGRTHEGRILIFPGSTNISQSIPVHAVNGTIPNSRFGSSVRACGDVNGDRLTDLVVGTVYGTGGTYRNGRIDMIYGAEGMKDLRAVMFSETAREWCATDYFVAGAGDVNGDGFDDVIVGYAFFSNGDVDEGRVCLHLGAESGLDAAPALAIEGRAAHAWLGMAVAGVGDVNGDGAPDVAVSSAFQKAGLDYPKVIVASDFKWIDSVLTPAREEACERERPSLRDQAKEVVDEWFVKVVSDEALAGGAKPHEESIPFLIENLPKLMQCANTYADILLARNAAFIIGYSMTMRGKMDDAVRYRAIADRFVLPLWLLGQEKRRSEILLVGIETLAGRVYALEQQGKQASARFCRMKLIQWYTVARPDLEAPRNRKLYDRVLSTEQRLAVGLHRDGEHKQAQAVLEDALKRADERHFAAQAGRIANDLAYLAFLLEDRDAMVHYATRRLAAPVDNSTPGLDDRQYVAAYWILSECNGVTDDMLDKVDAHIKKLEDMNNILLLMNARIHRAVLTAKKGDAPSALGMLDNIIAESEKAGHVLIAASALRYRAEINFTLKNPELVEKDCESALRVFRALGLKFEEMRLYELCGLSLAMRGQDASALQTLNAAFELARADNLPHRALRVLCHLLEFHMERGNTAGIQGILNRIAAFLDKHPNMPAPTWQHYLAVREKALSKIADRIASAGKPTAAPASDVGREIPGTDSASPSVGTIALDAHMILQPSAMISTVRGGELARGRFILHNPSATQAEGRLRVEGAPGVSWIDETPLWHATLSNEVGGAAETGLVRLDPGASAVIVLQTDIQDAAPEREVTLLWKGATEASSTWQVGLSDEVKDSQVVNLSYGRANPFFYSSFYHEVYYRGTPVTFRNLKAIASPACRLEFVTSDTGRLLAVDANGDGDFRDVGDVICQDNDNNGFPDLVFGPQIQVAAFELLVYPESVEDKSASEITIDIHLESDGVWECQGSDILRLSPAADHDLHE